MTGSADMLVVGWLLALMVAGVAGREARRRTALNRALHELRRPLQALTLALPAGSRMEQRPAASSLGLAISALADLDRIVNGRKPAESEGACRGRSPAALRSGPVPCRDLVAAAVRRWRARARLAGASIELEWQADGVVVNGDRAAISQAVDNLIVNAIEHGGPTIVLTARRREGRLRIAVVDSGCASRPRSRGRGAQEAISRLSGRRRHGHGLAVVRRVASTHGGRFAFSRAAAGSLAVLELPLADDDPGWAA
jgi:signal transduction histidine kinase